MSTLQAQRAVQDVVFGPYDSRRFGRSLGVNPLPKGSRLCNFDCIYCEWAAGSWPLEWQLRPQFPTPEDILTHLGSKQVQAKTDADLKRIPLEGTGKMKPVKDVNAQMAEDIIAHVRTLAQK